MIINTTMGSQILKCQMSKTFALFTVYFRHTIPSDYRCSIRIHKIAGPNPGPFSWRLKMSLCQPRSGWLPFLFWVIGKNEAAKGDNWLRISYALSKIHWASDPHRPLQPLDCAGSLDLYLSRRQCNSRFRCTQLSNTTLHLF